MVSNEECTELTTKLLALHNIGDFDKTFEAMITAVGFHKADPDLITAKWTEYIDMCTVENRPSRFIKTLSAFLNDQMWKQNFQSKDKDAGANWHLKMQELLKDQNMDI